MTSPRKQYLRPVDDDGLPAADVGSWAEEKYRRIGMYTEILSTGMRSKWDCRVYVDLFAGPGHAIIRDTPKRVLTSALLAVDVPHPFDQYVFCDRDSTAIDALGRRARRMAPRVSVAPIVGDVNEVFDRVAAAIPAQTKSRSVLTCCFVDPYTLEIHFDTIRALARERVIDFVTVLMLQMDANRNESTYVQRGHPRIDNLLGDTTWRPRWRAAALKGTGFVSFLADEYSDAMERLGYIRPGVERRVKVRMPEKNVPLYYIVPFCRHERGYEYWGEVLKYSSDQPNFL